MSVEVKKAFDKFGKRVVKESRTALTKKKINASKELYNSINYTAKVSKNSIEFTLNMLDYGKFIDKGVKGAKSSKRAPNSLFKTVNQKRYQIDSREFKTGINRWMVIKGIAPRNKKGQFTSRENINFLIRRKIYNYGIKTTNFLTKPLESAYKSLPDEVVEAYALTVDKLLANTK